jgi:glycerol-3-phosphate dehydrogenase
MTPRDARLSRIRENVTWDLVIIGGGATGLGSAVDAVTRGYRTLLLEASDFAKATSSRSTKLVHGGVRYLAQGNVSLVREALLERGRLLANAPHLVHQRSFLVPFQHWWEAPYYGVGLSLYDRLAGSLSLGRSRIVSRDEALRLAPTVEPDALLGGIVYQDGQFDDARLAVALARTIDDHGGVVLNYVAVSGFIKDAMGRILGVRARDAESGEEFEIKAKGVINATGVFADDVRKLDDPHCSRMLAPSQGAHLVLDRSFLPGETAILVPKTDDGRVLFAIPWHDRVVIGTTDTPVSATSLEPRPLAEELGFLMKHAARYLVRDPKPEDVLSVYAGLRPLVGTGGSMTSKISREYATVVSSSGLITITGGKWTTYRSMAESAINLATMSVGLLARPCVTVPLRLHGAHDESANDPLAVYGSDRSALEALISERPALGDKLHARLPYVEAEVVWATRHESARTVEDVLARRTRALLLDARAGLEASVRVAELMAGELGKDSAWRDDQVRSFAAVAEGYLMPI